ncbi:MAG TPA: RluA family pseudouridine synthase [Polyangia bacterium]|jgi:23S rRNA pseudouridine1911/1915/1917 synthase
MSHSSRFDFVVPEDVAGERLDRAMARVVPGMTRGEARRLIAAGVVFVGGRRTGISSRTVRAGEHLQWDTPVAVAVTDEGGGAQPRIVLERPELWIIDKPAGMPVEPTRGGTQGTLVDWLRRHHGGGLITHRLDVATSGLLVVAREREALVELNALFAAHTVRRLYLAVVSPAPEWERTTLNEPLDGRPAVTHASVVVRAATAALVRVELETGRTQQIRRHLRLGGHPVVGENAGGARSAGRLLLHAFSLSIPWPAAPGRELHATAPAPDDFVVRATTLALPIPTPDELLLGPAASPPAHI